jgi:hypothetical protein
MAMGYPDEVINPERGKVKEGTRGLEIRDKGLGRRD